METRKAREQDHDAIQRVHGLAFGQADEGHILFSPVTRLLLYSGTNTTVRALDLRGLRTMV